MVVEYFDRFYSKKETSIRQRGKHKVKLALASHTERLFVLEAKLTDQIML